MFDLYYKSLSNVLHLTVFPPLDPQHLLLIPLRHLYVPCLERTFHAHSKKKKQEKLWHVRIGLQLFTQRNFRLWIRKQMIAALLEFNLLSISLWMQFLLVTVSANFWSSAAFCNYVEKRKAIPLQAWTGPEGFRRLRLPDFKTIGSRMW